MNNTKEHVLGIIVKYIPATDTKGSRIKMTLPRFKKSKTIPFDHSFTLSYQIAEDFLSSNGIEVKAEADFGDDHLLLVNWQNITKVCQLFGI